MDKVEILEISAAGDANAAKNDLNRFIKTYQQTALNLAQCAEPNALDGLAIYQLPLEHRKRMRTTNLQARQSKKVKRRTRVATLFPNEDLLLRLGTSVLIKLSDDWTTAKRYITIKNQNRDRTQNF